MGCQGRRNRAIKFLDDGGDCDVPEDHMETKLNAFLMHLSVLDTNQAVVPTKSVSIQVPSKFLTFLVYPMKILLVLHP